MITLSRHAQKINVTESARAKCVIRTHFALADSVTFKNLNILLMLETIF